MAGLSNTIYYIIVSGAMHPSCKLCIFMGKTATSGPVHRQQSMILVPMDTPGVTVVRPLMVFGVDEAPRVYFRYICFYKYFPNR